MRQAFRATLSHPYFWFTLGMIWTGIVIFYCFTPHPPKVEVNNFDKLEHFIAFAGLALWFGSVYETRRHLRIVLLLALLGIAIEIGQGLTGYRDRDLLDFVADSIGIAAGIALAWTPLGRALRYIEARVIPARN